MPPTLSPDTELVVNALFGPQDRDEAIRLLADECGNNLPNEQNSDEYQLEELRLQVLRISKGNLKALRDSIDIAKQDFRELYRRGNLKAFKLDVLGDPQAAQRVRRIGRLFLALIGLSGFAALGIGVSGVSSLWLALPVVLIAITTEASYRNSTDRRFKGHEGLVVVSRVWSGVAIAGIGYVIGHFVARVFIQ